ncbi:hypothetical protein LV79_004726 [Actinokineospora globicatena]|nr:hypothetical protein [Actinokineospora globicatena]GLW80476.1 hypothetical protein Aglo01_49570 [Actinokineospora globicatena]GLW87304.1 hypothetical protein Aglo02_49430 [Actinokineospora globicatena]
MGTYGRELFWRWAEGVIVGSFAVGVVGPVSWVLGVGVPRALGVVAEVAAGVFAVVVLGYLVGGGLEAVRRRGRGVAGGLAVPVGTGLVAAYLVACFVNVVALAVEQRWVEVIRDVAVVVVVVVLPVYVVLRLVGGRGARASAG